MTTLSEIKLYRRETVISGFGTHEFYERDTAAEAVIEAARGVLDGDSEGAINLQDALSSFDSSRGGSR
jgi:hypothetical protein